MCRSCVTDALRKLSQTLLLEPTLTVESTKPIWTDVRRHYSDEPISNSKGVDGDEEAWEGEADHQAR